jgi:hypothetical protein
MKNIYVLPFRSMLAICYSFKVSQSFSLALLPHKKISLYTTLFLVLLHSLIMFCDILIDKTGDHPPKF